MMQGLPSKVYTYNYSAKIFPAFTEPKGSLQCSQKPATSLDYAVWSSNSNQQMSLKVHCSVH